MATLLRGCRCQNRGEVNDEFTRINNCSYDHVWLVFCSQDNRNYKHYVQNKYEPLRHKMGSYENEWRGDR